MQLTSHQAWQLEHARQVLDASVIDSDHTKMAYHLGAFEVVLANLVRIIEDLTAGGDQ
jgi:hypothetical protein